MARDHNGGLTRLGVVFAWLVVVAAVVALLLASKG